MVSPASISNKPGVPIAAEPLAAKETAKPSAAVEARQQLNASIVQASMSVAISSGNEPLALLYKSAITGINETLEPQFGPNAIQNAMGQDNSPEGTAGRIVQLSTAFFAAYKQQNPGVDDEQLLQGFMDKIGSGIAKGFEEARGILEGIGVLNGELAGNIDKTFDLVQQGLADFATAQRAGAKAAAEQNEAAAKEPAVS